MFENMKLKRIEWDDYHRISAIEFGDDCLVKDIVEFCNYYGLARFQKYEPEPLEPPTKRSAIDDAALRFAQSVVDSQSGK